MPKRKIPVSPDHPYHIGARCINKEWFQIPLPEVWEIMSDYLFLINKVFGVEILAFVLMSNHFHLLVRFPNLKLAEALNYFMRETSLRISRRAGRINQVYGGPHFKSLLLSEHHFLNVYKYLYRNPVEAGICTQVESYQFSTLNGLLGMSPLYIPVSHDETLFNDVEGVLRWLNLVPDPAHHLQIKNALRRSEFSFAIDRRTGKQSILETLRY